MNTELYTIWFGVMIAGNLSLAALLIYALNTVTRYYLALHTWEEQATARLREGAERTRWLEAREHHLEECLRERDRLNSQLKQKVDLLTQTDGE